MKGATQHSRLMANPTGRLFGAQGAWLWPALVSASDIPQIVLQSYEYAQQLSREAHRGTLRSET